MWWWWRHRDAQEAPTVTPVDHAWVEFTVMICSGEVVMRRCGLGGPQPVQYRTVGRLHRSLVAVHSPRLGKARPELLCKEMMGWYTLCIRRTKLGIGPDVPNHALLAMCTLPQFSTVEVFMRFRDANIGYAGTRVLVCCCDQSGVRDIGCL